jgi:hypothetical protein
MAGIPHPSGHRWRIFKQLVTRTYGDVCVVCLADMAGLGRLAI